MSTFKDEALLGGFGQAAKAANPLDALNDRQRLAATTLTGPLKVLAGAGTGKTTMIIARITHIIQSNAARADQVLAVTFTKKAAGEMRARLNASLGYDIARKIMAGNFHAICSEILRRHAHLVGLPANFNILDDQGQREVLATLALERGYISNKKDTYRVSSFLEQISSWKEEGYDSDYVMSLKNPQDIILAKLNQDESFGKQAAQIFSQYQEMLRLRRWCDFSDLVLHVVRIFRAHENIRILESSRYTHVMADEYQDTSPVQDEWIYLMTKDHRNICVVGDTDQSIYEWRNARPEIMLNFLKKWPDAVEVTIDTNYRSTQEILDVANSVVAPLRAVDKLDKKLVSPKRGIEPADLYRSYTTSQEEAEAIARQAKDLIDQGESPNEIAILCRSAMIISGIEKALRDNKMPYVVAGAMKFTEREEIKDAIAHLQLASNPMDFVAFERVVARPKRGIGGQKLGAIKRAMITNKSTVSDAIDSVAESMNKRTEAYRAMVELSDFIKFMNNEAKSDQNCGQILENILEVGGYLSWRETNLKDAMRTLRMENLSKIISEAQPYETASEFLESMALQSAGDMLWSQDCVIISTVHASKGLEFNAVFTPAMEDGIFPNSRSEKTAFGAHEERRLAHVAWTRARNRLYVSHAQFRTGRDGQSQPSPYLAEAGFLDFVKPKSSSLLGKRRFKAVRF